ncbi:MAG TPA: OPT/YSL family transporter, partial [Clostridia bacterium]|nr:OPT/YSL family transporter [Clostridia bacterium]
FVAVLSFALMRLIGRSDVNEINVAATGMSAGAMVAGGLVFTLPGLFISGIWDLGQPGQTAGDFLKARLPLVLFVALAGVLLGTALCWLFRKRNIEDLNLPYPIGKAAASTLEAGKKGGSQALTLLVALLLAAGLTLLRDHFGLFPPLLAFSIAAFPLTFYMSPMAIGIGGLIGFSSTLYWLLGAAITSLARFLILETSLLGSIPGAAEKLGEWNLTVAVALMVGAGLGTLIAFLFGTYKKKGSRRSASSSSRRRLSAPRGMGLLSLILVALAFVITLLTGMKVLPALLLMAGVFFAALLSSLITGQTGINPMEIFGIIVLLAIRALVTVSPEHAFFIAAIVAVTCGYAGDMMNDYKSGAILKTNPTAQFVIELVGGFFGAFTASIALLAIIYSRGGVGMEVGLPAAQAHSVTAMVAGLGNPILFAIAALIGCALTLFLKIPAMIIGIGMMLTGAGLALPIFLGGLLEYLSRTHLKKDSQSAIQMGAAGLLGGEGIMGTLLAIIALFR